MKKIPRLKLTDAEKLSALDLNKIHFSDKRTILTPETLEKIALSYKKGQSPDNQ